jgi:hypothetical protein
VGSGAASTFGAAVAAALPAAPAFVAALAAVADGVAVSGFFGGRGFAEGWASLVSVDRHSSVHARPSQ